jgi:hypothetical protein
LRDKRQKTTDKDKEDEEQRKDTEKKWKNKVKNKINYKRLKDGRQTIIGKIKI